MPQSFISINRVGNLDTEILKTGALVLCPTLVAMLAVFVRSTVVKILAKVEALDRSSLIMGKDMEMLSEKLKAVSHVGAEWALMKQDVGQVILEMKNIKASLEAVIILKRDQQTMWKRIDELREDLREKKSGDQ